MLQRFADALAQNLADMLVLALIVGLVAAGVLFWRARARHVERIRRLLRGEIAVPGKVQQALAKALNADAAEVGAIGVVSFVDLAWQYSLADPAIWDHLDSAAAAHLGDAAQSLDVLRAAYGGASLAPLLDRFVETLRGIEALHVFSDLAGKLPIIGEGAALALEGKATSVADSLLNSASTLHTAAEAKAGAAVGAGLSLHIPFVSMGFAAYRAWRRAQQGASLPRNVEFAAVEVATRATGGLLGGKVGGVIGTAIAPVGGTVVGAVAGAVAGTLGGAALGEAIKKRHTLRASQRLDQSLERLGAAYLDDDARFEQVTGVFRRQEEAYLGSLRAMRRRLRRYALPWRVAWPDEKLILLGETVRMAEDRLGSVQQGTVEAVERLDFMRQTGQRRELGVMLWRNPALCAEIPCDAELVGEVQRAGDRLQRELSQFGARPAPAPA